MRKGENIFKRKDGRWEGRYHKGRNNNGKLIYGYCYGKTYSETKKKVEEAKLNKTNISYKNRKITFKRCCDEWLLLNQSKLKESTITKYQCIINKHIYPKLGNYYLEELDSVIINKFGQDLLYIEQYSAKSVKDILLVIHSILLYIEKQYPNKLQHIEIIYPKITHTNIRVLSKIEQQKLVFYLNKDRDVYKSASLLALSTGLRIGELCALLNNNISISDKMLKVDSTVQRIKNTTNNGFKTKIIFSKPKTESSIRTIPLTNDTLKICKELYTQKDCFLLSGTTQCIEPRLLQHHFQKYIADCGLEDVHFHTLRHTFATRCIESGMDVKTLSELLGHSNVNITMNRYVHPSLDYKRANLEKVKFI